MQTLNQLVTYLTEEKQNSDKALREILRSNHPMFSQLRRLLAVSYRIFFTNRAEFSQWLKAARQYEPVDSENWDSPDFEEWIRDETGKASKILKVAAHVFSDNGALVIYTASQWNSAWVSVEYHSDPKPSADNLAELIVDDDAPF